MPVLSLSILCSQDDFLSTLLKVSAGSHQLFLSKTLKCSHGSCLQEEEFSLPVSKVFYLLKKLRAKLMQEAADDRRSSTKWIASVSQTAKVNAVHCRSGDRLFVECAGFERCSDKGAHKAIDKRCVKSP